MTYTTPVVDIYGIPGGVPTRVEYTNQEIATLFAAAIHSFVQVLNEQSASDITNADVQTVNNALIVLTNLAKYGIITTGAGRVLYPSGPIDAAYLAANGLGPNQSSYTQSYMTMSMAQNYDQIIRSLAAVGANVDASGSNFPSLNLTQLQQWKDLALQITSIAQAVRAAQIDGLTGSKSLQNMIEVDYVQTGNEIISKNMAQLKSALGITQQVLDTLADLQNLHNQITTRVAPFDFDVGAMKILASLLIPGQAGYIDLTLSAANASGAPSAWAIFYQRAASAYFGKQIVPVLISSIAPGGPHYVSAFQSLVKIRDSLISSFAKLSAMTSAAVRNNPTSLYSRLKTVIDDIRNSFTDNNGNQVNLNTTPADLGSGFQRWMLDNYASFNSTGLNKAGGYQQNITFAITSAENLNDTQKETVRNYLFVFEEFYKSASAALQAISQIIQKMAQNISR